MLLIEASYKNFNPPLGKVEPKLVNPFTPLRKVLSEVEPKLVNPLEGIKSQNLTFITVL